MRQIRPIVLNREETIRLVQTLVDNSNNIPAQLVQCLNECICQTDYDINILCRLTQESYKSTVSEILKRS